MMEELHIPRQTGRQADRQTNRRVIQIQTDRREGHLPGGRVGT